MSSRAICRLLSERRVCLFETLQLLSRLTKYRLAFAIPAANRVEVQERKGNLAQPRLSGACRSPTPAPGGCWRSRSPSHASVAFWSPLHSRPSSLSDQGQVVLAVPVAHGLRFAGIGQPLQGILADRLQHAVVSPFGDHQRAVHEPAEHVKHFLPSEPSVSADCFRRRQRAATGKHGQALQQQALRRRELVIGPVDRRAAAFGGGAAPACRLTPAGAAASAAASGCRPGSSSAPGPRPARSPGGCRRADGRFRPPGPRRHYCSSNAGRCILARSTNNRIAS